MEQTKIEVTIQLFEEGKPIVSFKCVNLERALAVLASLQNFKEPLIPTHEDLFDKEKE